MTESLQNCKLNGSWCGAVTTATSTSVTTSWAFRIRSHGNIALFSKARVAFVFLYVYFYIPFVSIFFRIFNSFDKMLYVWHKYDRKLVHGGLA